MADLVRRQQQLWQALAAASKQQPMLRLNREDDSLWICDLPRRCDAAACQAAEVQVIQAGFSLWTDEKSKLWKIDLPLSDPLLADNPTELPPFPVNELLHPIYALCRLLQSHPAPARQQPVRLLRGILKLTMSSPAENQSQAAWLTSQCAALLNRKEPLPSAACHALCQYILKEDKQ